MICIVKLCIHEAAASGIYEKIFANFSWSNVFYYSLTLPCLLVTKGHSILKQTSSFLLQICLSNMYGLLLPPDIQILKLLFIMPGGKKGHIYLCKVTVGSLA